MTVRRTSFGDLVGWGLGFVFCLGSLAWGCTPPERGGCTSDEECRLDRVCRDGRCVAPVDGGGGEDASTDTGDDVDPPDDATDVPPDDGDAGRPLIEGPRNVGFQETPVGGRRSRLLSFENTGTATLDVRAVRLDQSQLDGRAFRVTYPDPSAPDDPTSDRRPEGDDAWPVDGVSSEVEPGDAFLVRVRFAPAAPHEGSVRAALEIESNADNAGVWGVSLVGQVREMDDNECPTAEARGRGPESDEWSDEVSANPESLVRLDGSQSSDPDGRVARYSWSLVEHPPMSNASLLPSGDEVDPELRVDVPGTYRVDLQVFDDDGVANCGAPASVRIEVTAAGEIRLELTWNTPKDENPNDDSGADLDLHYRHPNASSWNEDPWDIYWQNEQADWGERGDASDDPEMTNKVDDGQGPEVIVHPNPEDGDYRVGVYYYDDHGFGTSYPRLRVYFDGQLQYDVSGPALEETFLFWKAGTVEWPERNFVSSQEVTEGFPTN